jgi:hypothetical protein
MEVTEVGIITVSNDLHHENILLARNCNDLIMFENLLIY